LKVLKGLKSPHLILVLSCYHQRYRKTIDGSKPCQLKIQNIMLNTMLRQETLPECIVESIYRKKLLVVSRNSKNLQKLQQRRQIKHPRKEDTPKNINSLHSKNMKPRLTNLSEPRLLLLR
jgi:hypothetical protein